MNTILSKTFYSCNVAEIVIKAPQIARSRRAGHFVIVRADEFSERIPLTIADADVVNGTITLVVQRIGVSSAKLLSLITEHLADAFKCLLHFLIFRT
jgi:NAD(P)H-flavin reductase